MRKRKRGIDEIEIIIYHHFYTKGMKEKDR